MKINTKLRRASFWIVNNGSRAGTTIAKALAEKTGFGYADADEFHSEENIKKMSEGQPLSDMDRLPWLCSIHSHLAKLAESGSSGIVTCSAMKRSYRNILRLGPGFPIIEPSHGSTVNHSCGNNEQADTHLSKPGLDLVFLHLTGSETILQARLSKRQGHFMQPRMLRSQLETLELLSNDEKGLTVDIDCSLDDIVKQVLKYFVSQNWITAVQEKENSKMAL